MADNFSYSKFLDVSPKPYSAYTSKVITVSGSTTDHSLKDNTELFSSLASPYEIRIKDITQDISIKFNSDSNDSIPILADNEFDTEGLIVTDIFVTVSGGSDASLNIIAFGWK